MLKCIAINHQIKKIKNWPTQRQKQYLHQLHGFEETLPTLCTAKFQGSGLKNKNKNEIMQNKQYTSNN